MGVLDIFKRKKKEDIGFEGENSFPSEQDHEETLGPPPFRDETLDSELRPKIFEQIQQPSGEDTQLLIAKIDLINQKLEVIDKRLQVIEKIAKESQ